MASSRTIIIQQGKKRISVLRAGVSDQRDGIRLVYGIIDPEKQLQEQLPELFEFQYREGAGHRGFRQTLNFPVGYALAAEDLNLIFCTDALHAAKQGFILRSWDNKTNGTHADGPLS